MIGMLEIGQGKKNMDLRAHHLLTLSRAHAWGSHQAAWREKFFRRLKSVECKILGYDDRRFADHLVDMALNILAARVASVTLVDGYDAICEACPQKGKAECHVFGRDWPADFLAKLDQAILRNTHGVFELGKAYPPEYLVKNMAVIRSALRKTFLELPIIWRRRKT